MLEFSADFGLERQLRRSIHDRDYFVQGSRFAFRINSNYSIPNDGTYYLLYHSITICYDDDVAVTM